MFVQPNVIVRGECGTLNISETNKTSSCSAISGCSFLPSSATIRQTSAFMVPVTGSLVDKRMQFEGEGRKKTQD